MATPRRRSSRLQNTSTPGRFQSSPLSKLSSLLERDESPIGIQSNIDAVVATPVAPSNSAFSQAHMRIQLSTIKTPQTESRVTLDEMHPSKVHQSTTKPMRALSSHPVNDVVQKSRDTPITAGDAEITPCKSRPSLNPKINSPVFDFSSERPESDLSVEAQKIMKSVREEAAKIKSQMMEERAKQEHHDEESYQLQGVAGREIKQPKGKSGRFSDAHKQEFRKMESIANHASTWKSRYNESRTPLLKRSPSKAGLDEATPKSMSKSKSMRSLHFNSTNSTNSGPGKRLKRYLDDDTSSARPVSRDGVKNTQKTPAGVPITSKLPSAVTTPTKSSLARSASVKNLKPSKLPSLCRSASTKALRRNDSNLPKTEGSNRYAASLSRFGGSMKSILRHTQAEDSEDPQILTAGSYFHLPKATLVLNKELPSLPSSPTKDQPPSQRSPTIKHVNDSESTSTEYPELTVSPSLSRMPKPQSANLGHNEHLSAPSPPKAGQDEQVSYPLLTTSPNITTRRPFSKPGKPGDFTFRSDKTIEFSPNKVSSPGGTTIRVVRPSGFPTPVPSSFDFLPSIPHGMANKKRKHDVAAENKNLFEDVTKENEKRKSVEEDNENEGQPRTKKPRMQMISSPSVEAQATNRSPLKRRFVSRAAANGGSRIPKRGGMSLARLTALARPKDRR